MKHVIACIFILFICCNHAIAQHYSDDEFAEFDERKVLVADPWEKSNRKIFAFNMAIDDYILAPVTRKYIALTSPDFRLKIRNVIVNLNNPSDVIISATQGDIQSMTILSWRFAINSIIGMGGLFDVASELGLKPIQKNISDTLGLYGVPIGHYIVIPFFGPSFARTSIDIPFNIALNAGFGDTIPLAYRIFPKDTVISNIAKDNSYTTLLVPLSIIDVRSRIIQITDDIDATSTDRYTAYRDMYYQYVKYQAEMRMKLIINGTYQKPEWNSENLVSASTWCINNPTETECNRKL